MISMYKKQTKLNNNNKWAPLLVHSDRRLTWWGVYGGGGGGVGGVGVGRECTKFRIS